MNPWLITLAVLVILAILPLGASVIYDRNGPLVRIIAGPMKIRVFPMKKKAGKPKAKKEKKPKAPDPGKQAAAAAKKAKQAEAKAQKEHYKDPDEPGGSILDFWPFVELGLNFLGDFRRRLRVNHLKLHLTMGGGDPCDLAVNYGRANAGMSALLAQLERIFVIRKRDVRVNCDFVAEETTILARLDLTITLGRIVGLLVRYGIRAVRTYLSIQKKRKGGANL